MTMQVGAQMFTLRDHCQTPSDIAESCRKVKAMGYDGIQASAAGFNKIDAAELKKILDDTGLVCAATHRSFDEMKQVDQIADWHQTVGCELTAIGGFAFGGKPLNEWEAFFNDFDATGKALADKGLRLGYHNHSHEFAPFGIEDDPASISPDKTPMNMLLEKLDPSIWFEIDTYWVVHGGGDPIAWLEKCAGRCPAIHVKDMTVTPSREQKMCEVGRGNLNWPGILDACKRAEVQWLLVERDRGDLDPFDSLKISLDMLRSWGI